MPKKSPAAKQDGPVWIVDDDNIVARLLSHWLMQRGFSVQIISNGRDALESVSTNVPPRLILLDVMMPFADGLEVLSTLRARAPWKKVPVIMLSSKSNEASIVRAFEAGADDYVTKPFKLPELMVRMNRLLR